MCVFIMRFFCLLTVSLLTHVNLKAQYSKLYVRTTSTSTTGITTGTTSNDRVVGISHDGTAGYISTSSWGGSSDASPLNFLTDDEVRMTILENGYVGIGTSTPEVALAVAGKIHGREIRVNVNVGAPDYVFADDYRLLSLHEIRSYIMAHQRLPGVPAGSDMERDGINLSEMNMLLLKKVEELTLYTIQQQEELEQLHQQLSKQQDAIEHLTQQITHQAH